MLKVSLATRSLAAMAKADSVAGRICNRQFRLDARAQRIVKAFAIRFPEEVAFASQGSRIRTSVAAME